MCAQRTIVCVVFAISNMTHATTATITRPRNHDNVHAQQ